jgi:hypothetical protein
MQRLTAQHQPSPRRCSYKGFCEHVFAEGDQRQWDRWAAQQNPAATGNSDIAGYMKLAGDINNHQQRTNGIQTRLSAQRPSWRRC